MMKKKIVFAEKYGVCSGVKNALNLVNQELTSNNSQIYVFHEIVHNSFVINNLKKNGVIFTENINTIPDHSTIIFSAHGVSKEIEKQAAAKKLKVIDGTCPLVKKIIKSSKMPKHEGITLFLSATRNMLKFQGLTVGA